MVEAEQVILAELEALAPRSEVPAADWRQVTKRFDPSPTRPRLWRPRLAVGMAAVALIAVAAASAAYLASRGEPSRPPANGAIVIDAQPGEVAQLSSVGTDGRLRKLWSCPQRRFCGTPTGMSWSPDGKRIALVMVTLGRSSHYEGLDVLTLSTRRFAHLTTSRYCQGNGFGLLGGVDWSPNGRWIAFTCGSSKIELIRPNGSGEHAVSTGLTNVQSPSWSPDGERLAFSAGAIDHSSVYLIGADGKHRRRLARGRAPAWSPDSTLIAYRAATHGASCGGLRLVDADTGRDASPASASNPCHQFGPRQVEAPAWSPDGTEIVVGSTSGVYVINADGTHLRLVTPRSPYSGQPAWRPTRGVPSLRYATRNPQCSEC